MKVGTKVLGVAALALMLSQAACGRKPQPRPEYGETFVNMLIDRLLQDPEPQTRCGAAYALAQMNDPIAKKAACALSCALYDDHPLVRQEVARALKVIDPSWSMP